MVQFGSSESELLFVPSFPGLLEQMEPNSIHSQSHFFKKMNGYLPNFLLKFGAISHPIQKASRGLKKCVACVAYLEQRQSTQQLVGISDESRKNSFILQ